MTRCGRGLPSLPRDHASRSPQQVVLLGAVVSAQGLQLGLAFAQLRKDLILRVLRGAVLRLQEALGNQLLLDAALQRLSVRHAAGEGRALSLQGAATPAPGPAWRGGHLGGPQGFLRSVNTLRSPWLPPALTPGYMRYKNRERPTHLVSVLKYKYRTSILKNQTEKNPEIPQPQKNHCCHLLLLFSYILFPIYKTFIYISQILFYIIANSLLYIIPGIFSPYVHIFKFFFFFF